MITEQIIEAIVLHIYKNRKRIINEVCNEDTSELGVVASIAIDKVVDLLVQLKPQNQPIDVLDS